ncbi:OadG family protein [Sedimenticola hydrogenitrophicus]|uniref:OadG family protein n=1 Tax=Sedimenticola hydrogenitrophicus TaxID=2967975 RepID=UPI0021A4460A|nr:OadG family protein [Sedimenticola hydrogenitrophicus]
MHVADLLVEGVNLMLLGMGSVFLFLTVLVLAMNGVSRLAAPYADDGARGYPRHQPASATAGNESEEIVAVISAAISRYRNRS